MCAVALAQMQSTQQQVDQLITKTNTKVVLKAEDCDLLGGSDNVGYLTYHADGWTQPSNEFQGQIKSLMILIKYKGEWVIVQDEVFKFLPPPPSSFTLEEEAAPKRKLTPGTDI